MTRYLIYISYIGTNYRGIQKVSNIGKNESIQEVLEVGLKGLRTLKNVPILKLSSRTDKGVHALRGTAHVDLEDRDPNRVFLPQQITQTLNKYLQKRKHQITVQKTLMVPSNFHCRANAKWRRYVYRLAVVQPEVDVSQCYPPKIMSAITPVLERDRTLVLASTFSLDSASRACELFRGTHDFATFMGTLGFGNVETTVKHLEEMEMRPSAPLSSPQFDPLYHNLLFYEVHVRAKSFLNKQVRRMVGAMVAAGYGNVSLDDVKFMIDNPGKDNWVSRVATAPPYALYLADVHYDYQDLVYNGPLEIDQTTGQIIKRHDTDLSATK